MQTAGSRLGKSKGRNNNTGRGKKRTTAINTKGKMQDEESHPNQDIEDNVFSEDGGEYSELEAEEYRDENYNMEFESPQALNGHNFSEAVA